MASRFHGSTLPGRAQRGVCVAACVAKKKCSAPQITASTSLIQNSPRLALSSLCSLLPVPVHARRRRLPLLADAASSARRAPLPSACSPRDPVPLAPRVPRPHALLPRGAPRSAPSGPRLLLAAVGGRAADPVCWSAWVLGRGRGRRLPRSVGRQPAHTCLPPTGRTRGATVSYSRLEVFF